MECPLTEIHSENEPVNIASLANGWFLRGAGDAHALFTGYTGAVICRTSAGADADVVQLGIGLTTSTLCNAIYHAPSDTAFVFAADELRIVAPANTSAIQLRWNGPLTVTVLECYFRSHRGLAWYTPLDRTAFPRPPAGWCSWYEYYLEVTEDEMVKNIDWLVDHLQPYGCDWIQIDDGWQGKGIGFGSNRDWYVTSAQDFPHGMRWMADYIRAKGFRAGLWLIPVAQSDTRLFAEHPEMFLRREDGTSIGEVSWPIPEVLPPDNDGQWVAWAGRYLLDPTSPEALAYLRRLFTMLCHEWGYDYIKIDAQGEMCTRYQQHRRLRADPSLDGARAMRLATGTMKEVMGPDRFLLNCLLDFTSCGICGGIRTGGDIDLRTGWEGMQPAINATLDSLWLNTYAFYTDPDAVCVREPLPFALAQLWATLLGITGQLLMASDRMYTLGEDRVELLRRIFPVADIHPMELYPLNTQHPPRIFDVKVALPEVGQWDVVALFNWSETEASTIELTPQRLGLTGAEWICLDAWAGTPLSSDTGQLSIELASMSSRVVTYWPRLGHPQVVGSNRHLTQGAVDLVSVRWDARTATLSGTSRVVGGETYRLRLFVPKEYHALSPDLILQDEFAELALSSPGNVEVEWAVRFAR